MIQGTGKLCPKCNDGNRMINLTSFNLRICDCGYKEDFYLKPGQKSILEKNKVGGKDDDRKEV